MSPVASRWEVPRKSVGLGVGEGDVPAGLGVVLPVFVGLGVVGRDGVGDEPVDDDGAAACRGRRAVRRPRSRRPWGRRWVWRATRRACQAGTSSRTDAFPEHGEPVAQVEGVGDQLGPGRRGHAQRQRERFRGERRHRRGCRRRRVTRRPAAPPHRTSRLRCRWWRGGGRPSARRAGACGTRRVVRLVRLRRRLRAQPAGSRSPTSYSSRTVVLMGLSQASTTDTRTPQNPLVHKGILDRDLLVTWSASGHASHGRPLPREGGGGSRSSRKTDPVAGDPRHCGVTAKSAGPGPRKALSCLALQQHDDPRRTPASRRWPS